MPAQAGIQYAGKSASNRYVSVYWIGRWSLSSGGALRRPGGG
jgi:hypothetical protein